MIKRPTGRASCSNSPSPATAAAISPLSPRRRWRSRPPGRATSSALSSGASTPPRRPWRGRSRTSSPTPASTSAAGGSPLGIPARRGRGWSGCARATRATCGLRGQYAYEAQLLGAERQRRAEARAEAARLANEERKATKAAAAQTRAAERRAFEKDFRQALVSILPSPSLPPYFAFSTLAHDLFVELPSLLNESLIRGLSSILHVFRNFLQI